MPSPLFLKHNRMDNAVFRLLEHYAAHTPGLELTRGVTTRLGKDSEVQPDLALMTIAASEVRDAIPKEGFIAGAPELVVEIAMSTAPTDLFEKKALYEQHGVREYLVVLVREPKKVSWFARRGE